jgi:hypothetical protein
VDPIGNIVRTIGKYAAGDAHLLVKARTCSWSVIHQEWMDLIETDMRDYFIAQ